MGFLGIAGFITSVALGFELLFCLLELLLATITIYPPGFLFLLGFFFFLGWSKRVKLS